MRRPAATELSIARAVVLVLAVIFVLAVMVVAGAVVWPVEVRT